MSRNVIILGAGVVGLCTALECARRGYSVTVIDREPVGRNGCSFGNAGMVVPSHFIPLAAPGVMAQGIRWMFDPSSPFYLKPRPSPELLAWGYRFWKAAKPARVASAAPVLRDLGLLSRECYESIGLDFGLVQKGLLMLCKKQETLDEEAHTADMARSLGLPAEVLDAGSTAALDPGLTMDVIGSVFFPRDCHLPPARFIAALEAELVRLGVTFLWENDVRAFAGEGGKIAAVQTGRGEVGADEIVLCAGVWSTGLAKSLGLSLPMQAGKGYSLTMRNPRQLPELCSICTEARLAVTPMDGQLRFGGTMEITGIDESIAKERVRGIVRAVPQYFPAFDERDFDTITPWTGLRPLSPDGMPYLGRTRRWKNLVVATGHAMMGLSLAPATGRIVADLLEEKEPEVDLRLLDPERFG